VSQLFDGAPEPQQPAPSSPRSDTPASAPDDDAAEPSLADPYAVADDGVVADRYPGAVPPGYDWPTHGGYLGCLMGVVVGLLLGGFLGSALIGLLSVSPASGLVSVAAGRLMLLGLTFFATLIVLGRVGYRLGRRYYREYPTPPRRRWEE
jgi:hypothetical protein